MFPFSCGTLWLKERGYHILTDEILRYAQNDQGGAGFCHNNSMQICQTSGADVDIGPSTSYNTMLASADNTQENSQRQQARRVDA
jgi:hypothetical protein